MRGRAASSGLVTAGLLPDGGAELRQVSADFLHARRVLDGALPLRLSPEHRLPQRVPQRRRDGAAGRAVGIPEPDLRRR